MYESRPAREGKGWHASIIRTIFERDHVGLSYTPAGELCTLLTGEVVFATSASSSSARRNPI